MKKDILLINPVKEYLSLDVYGCLIKDTGLPPEKDLVEYLNKYYSSFVDAVTLVSMGEIENLDKVSYSKFDNKIKIIFQSLSKAKEELKDHNLYYYDMSLKKYTWIKL